MSDKIFVDGFVISTPELAKSNCLHFRSDWAVDQCNVRNTYKYIENKKLCSLLCKPFSEAAFPSAKSGTRSVLRSINFEQLSQEYASWTTAFCACPTCTGMFLKKCSGQKTVLQRSHFGHFK